MKQSNTPYWIAALLIIGILIFDLNIELGVAGGVPYIAVVFATLWMPGKRFVLAAMGLTTFLTLYGYWVSPSGGEEWKVLTNRALAIFAICVTGVVCLMQKKASQNLEEKVRERTEELSQTNLKLQDTLKKTEVLNEDLRRSNQELEKFAYISSHDLKSPLRAIDNLSKWIEEDSEDTLSESSKKDLATLRERVNRMNTLIEDLLQYSRIGHKKYPVEEISVKQLLDEVIRLIHVPEGFEINVDENMPVIFTAEPPLTQVFMNLIGNAIKHHHQPSQGRVMIASKNAGEFYEFSVADNGPGIPEEFHQQAFHMFQTLHSRDKVEGSGMGLAFIDKIVRLHGGRISLKSEKDHGATFYFSWPKQIREEIA